jgi:hypothetical protein
MIKIASGVVLVGVLVAGMQGVSASDSRFPYCVSAASDSDGDGYGWENEQTCLVADDVANSYTVTVHNLTYQQVFSPIIAVTHDDSVALLHAGEAAGAGVTAIAEGGDTSVLESELEGVSQVNGVATSGGPLPFAQHVSFDVHGAAGQVISVLSMLVNTNDALVVVNSLALPSRSGESVMTYAVAYDAGTETNDEICAHIPGPACGGSGASPDDDGEGFIHVHRGLQGVGDLDAARQDWRNPVAAVTVTRN